MSSFILSASHRPIRAPKKLLILGAAACVFSAGRVYSQQLPPSTDPAPSGPVPPSTDLPLREAFSPMQITGVYYLTQGEDRQWVELKNTGAAAIDLKGWRLRNGSNLDVAITASSLAVPPKSIVVVVLMGTGKATARIAPGTKTVNLANGQSGDVLGKKGGQLGLYEPGNDGLSIRSFVAWGQSPGSVFAEASRRRLWSNPADVVAGTEPVQADGVVRPLTKGGSIAVENPKAAPGPHRWGVFNGGSGIAGKAVLERDLPSVVFPLFEETPDNGLTTLSVVAEPKGTKYQFQIAKDQNFKAMVTDVTKDFPSYVMQIPVPRNQIYYWRVRLIHLNGSAGSWIPPRRLVNGFPRQ